MGAVPVYESERGCGPEPGNIADPGQNFPSGQIANAPKLGEGGAAGCDLGADLAGDSSDAPVQMAELRDKVSSQSTQRSGTGSAGTNGGQQPRGGIGTELPWCPTGQQLGQQDVEAVDRLGAGAHDVVAVLDQRTERDDGFLDRGGA